MERQEERRVPGASLSVVTRHWLGLETARRFVSHHTCLQEI